MGGTVTNHTFGPQVEAGIRPVRWGFSVGHGAHGRHEPSPTVPRRVAMRALERLTAVEALAELGPDVRDWFEQRPPDERAELLVALREQLRG